MVQQMEGSGVREDRTPRVRKAFALVRNSDGKFHVGGTYGRFTSVGKLFVLSGALRNALSWFMRGPSRFVMCDELDGQGVVEPGNHPRDLREYTIVEYELTEVRRTPADRW